MGGPNGNAEKKTLCTGRLLKKYSQRPHHKGKNPMAERWRALMRQKKRGPETKLSPDRAATAPRPNNGSLQYESEAKSLGGAARLRENKSHLAGHHACSVHTKSRGHSPAEPDSGGRQSTVDEQLPEAAPAQALRGRNILRA